MTDSLALQLIHEIVQAGNPTALRTLIGGGATGDAASAEQIIRLCRRLRANALTPPYPFEEYESQITSLYSLALEMQYLDRSWATEGGKK